MAKCEEERKKGKILNISGLRTFSGGVEILPPKPKEHNSNNQKKKKETNTINNNSFYTVKNGKIDITPKNNDNDDSTNTNNKNNSENESNQSNNQEEKYTGKPHFV